MKKYSATGNRTPVSRVTGGDTHHYTIVELLSLHTKIQYIYRLGISVGTYKLNLS